MGFDLHWDDPTRGPSHDRMMLRMDPAESHNATSRKRELELLQAFDGVLPVPPAHWVDEDATYFPEPALIYGFVAGVTKPSATRSGQVSGMGTNFGPELRAKLAPQFMRHLAAIHTYDAERAAFETMDRPRTDSTEGALWQLNRARRIWEEDRGDDLPLMEVAANWLERNLPALDRVSVVHGDYRSGNFLFDEAGGEITGWLDWERGHLGDRHRDLAWTTTPTFGHYDEHGTYLVCGLVPLESFYAEYERVSGLSVDPERLRLVPDPQRVLDHRVDARDLLPRRAARKDPPGRALGPRRGRLAHRRGRARATARGGALMDHVDNALRASIKALEEVVAPAVDPADPQAGEQLRLVIHTLGFLRERVDHIHARARFDLRHNLGLASALLEDAPALRDPIAAGTALAANPDAPTAELRAGAAEVARRPPDGRPRRRRGRAAAASSCGSSRPRSSGSSSNDPGICRRASTLIPRARCRSPQHSAPSAFITFQEEREPHEGSAFAACRRAARRRSAHRLRLEHGRRRLQAAARSH